MDFKKLSGKKYRTRSCTLHKSINEYNLDEKNKLIVQSIKDFINKYHSGIISNETEYVIEIYPYEQAIFYFVGIKHDIVIFGHISGNAMTLVEMNKEDSDCIKSVVK